MSLDLPQLVPQIEAAGQTVAQRARTLRERLSQANTAVDELASLDGAALQARIDRAGDRWSGAIPADEPPSAAFDPPRGPTNYHVVAADGSQVYPDRHAAAMYALINIGGIHLHRGSGAAPATRSRPSLHYEPGELAGGQGGLSNADLIDGRRDVAELGELADMAHQLQGEPTLSLLDNGLLLWLLLQGKDQTQREVDELLSEYLAHLTRLRECGAALAGVVERPRHANVLALAHLGQLPEGSIDEDELRANPFRGLTDDELFQRRLQVGQRSACFIHGSPVNREFRAAGHEVRFFYLRSSPNALLRVEIPHWVAQKPELMNLVHAGLLEEGRATGGFAYALTRAHELAVVSHAEREELDRLLAQALLRHGLNPRRSQKSLIKRWSGHRRRHRL